MATKCVLDSNDSSEIVNCQSHHEFIHCDNIGKANLGFLKRQKHCDVTFEVGEEKKKIKCHKFFLMSRSPVFETMFSERWDTSGPITLPDVEPATFESFLEFVYGDKFTDSTPMAIRVLQLGHKYDVKPLVQKCEELLSQKLELKEVIETFIMARRYSLENLMCQAGDLMACNFEYLSRQGLRDMDEETLIYLLQQDNLRVEELKIFEIIWGWASDNIDENNNSSSHSEVLKNILPLLRFPLMTATEFATYVFPKQILPQNDAIDLFLYFNSEGTVREDVARRIQFSAVPRRKPVTLKLFTKVDQFRGLGDYFKALEYKRGHEDDLEICYVNEPSPGENGSNKVVTLKSLLLQGPDYDGLKEHWPEDEIPESEHVVCISIEKCDSSGTGSVIFTNKCFISKGEQSILTICPKIDLVVGSNYRIKTKFQGKVLAIIKRFQGKKDFYDDAFTCSFLTPTLRGPDLVGTLNVSPILPKCLQNRIFPSLLHAWPCPLHVVRGFNLIC